MIELNSDKTAAIDRATKWIPVGANTPRGVKLQLISKKYGVAQYGIWSPDDTYFTHYYPLPTFDKDEKYDCAT